MDRINDARNRVFYSDGLGLGKNMEYALHTSNTSVYRVTGINQIQDIVLTGYVRPKEGKLKGGHVNEVFWSIGGDKLFYYDKRPVIEVPEEKVKNDQIGAIHIDDIKAIWMFDENNNKYINEIERLKALYNDYQEQYTNDNMLKK